MNGFILINKPSGPTSHDIIYQLRRITGIKRIGHAGTLDPFASGLLLVGIGDATKLLRHYVGLDKTYEATIKLGAVSDTYDRTGKITNNQSPITSKITITNTQKILKSFIGKQKQVPPMYSAKKIHGQKLYELARQGKEIERKPQNIEIYDIKLTSLQFSVLRPPNRRTTERQADSQHSNSWILGFSTHVSSGTYIRSLAHDIGAKLGCGAYLEELKRTSVGDFKLNNAISVIAGRDSFAHNDILTPDNWQQYLIPLKTVLVTGTFDGIHEGHLNYFKQARELGNRVIAIVARDSTVEKIKNHAPIFCEKERIKQVKQCEEIDRVYLGSKDDQIGFALSLNPGVIALGYDQKAYAENLKKEIELRGLNIKIIRMKPYHPEKYKSSKLNQKN